MKLLVSTLAMIAYVLSSSAADVTLDWDPSPAPDISGYRVYYGTAPNSYTDVATVGNTTTATIAGLAVGVTYHFAATAISSSGAESDFSNEVSYTVPDDSIAPSISMADLIQSYDGHPKAVRTETIPAGLLVLITYNGTATPPIAAGSYTVIGSAVSSGVTVAVTNTMTISKAIAEVTVTTTARVYTGTPVLASVSTYPAGLNVIVTYNGSLVPPSQLGTYRVVGTIDDPNFTGTGEGTLRIKRISPPGGLKPIATGGAQTAGT